MGAGAKNTSRIHNKGGYATLPLQADMGGATAAAAADNEEDEPLARLVFPIEHARRQALLVKCRFVRG